MKPEFARGIEKFYRFKIQQCVPGPRQYVAETYILDDENGNRYFCKLTDKPLFIQNIIDGLPAIAEMRDKGIDRICYPTRGKDGLHFFIGKTLVVLYNYISAPQSEDYSMRAFGELTAKIHAITPKIVNKPPQESFQFSNRALFDEQFEGCLSSQSTDPAIRELKRILSVHEDEIRHYLDKFVTLGDACGKKPHELVLTHCDAPGNVLVKSPDDIYIIDWDEIQLAPAERDTWFIDQSPEFLEGYKIARPDFVTNKNMREFFILKYYFQRNMYYFADILNESATGDYRMGLAKRFEYQLLDGWMLPKLKEIG